MGQLYKITVLLLCCHVIDRFSIGPTKSRSQRKALIRRRSLRSQHVKPVRVGTWFVTKFRVCD